MDECRQSDEHTTEIEAYEAKLAMKAASNHIPLKKLISRYKTDLKLANYPNGQEQLNNETRRKNLKKASVLYYLELLASMLPSDLKN